jgi:hypothetical protein
MTQFHALIGLKPASSACIMKPSTTPGDSFPTSSISIGMTCWRWQRAKAKAIRQLAQKFGVTLQLTEKIRGLHRIIEAQVSGQNTDQFLGEFGRQ